MKVSKRSLIMSIAVLCVCALSLTAASFAWFSAVDTAKITALDMKVASASDLKIAVDLAADEAANIESTMWGNAFVGSDVATAQSNTFTLNPIADATIVDGSFVKPKDLTKVQADGSYDSETNGWDPAKATEDYVTFTVLFRSTQKDKKVQMSSDGLSITSANQNLLPALTLVIGDKTFTNGAKVENLEICTCSTEVVSAATGATYYVAEVEYKIYVDGESQYAVNANSGVNFSFGNIDYSYVTE